MRLVPRRAVALCCAALFLGACAVGQVEKRRDAMGSLFSELDGNGDGQIELAEARDYINTALGGPGVVMTDSAAAAKVISALDGVDTDATVSVHELEKSLSLRLKGTTVEQWVRHGLDLPQYTAAFTQHAISVSDFPLLLADDAAALSDELGVTSKLHRSKMVRAITRLILGLGAVPTAPCSVTCHVDKPALLAAGCTTASAVVAWRRADHEVPETGRIKYVVERKAGGEYSWTEIGAALSDTFHFCDGQAPRAIEGALYRVTAWSESGPSPPSYSEPCARADTASSGGSVADSSAAGGVAQPEPLGAGAGLQAHLLPWGASVHAAARSQSALFATGARSAGQKVGGHGVQSAPPNLSGASASWGDRGAAPQPAQRRAAPAPPRRVWGQTSLVNALSAAILLLCILTVSTQLLHSVLHQPSSPANALHVDENAPQPPAASPEAARRPASPPVDQCDAPPPAAVSRTPSTSSASVMDADSAERRPVGARSLTRVASASRVAGLTSLRHRRTKVYNRCNMSDCETRRKAFLGALRGHSEFHYCRQCQREFCLAHTAYVSHGKTLKGTCPLDAACMCELCWLELTPEQMTVLANAPGARVVATSRIAASHMAAGRGLKQPPDKPPPGSPASLARSSHRRGQSGDLKPAATDGGGSPFTLDEPSAPARHKLSFRWLPGRKTPQASSSMPHASSTGGGATSPPPSPRHPRRAVSMQADLAAGCAASVHSLRADSRESSGDLSARPGGSGRSAGEPPADPVLTREKEMLLRELTARWRRRCEGRRASITGAAGGANGRPSPLSGRSGPDPGAAAPDAPCAGSPDKPPLGLSGGNLCQVRSLAQLWRQSGQRDERGQNQ